MKTNKMIDEERAVRNAKLSEPKTYQDKDTRSSLALWIGSLIELAALLLAGASFWVGDPITLIFAVVLFVFGAVVARIKNHICRGCGNDLAKTSKVCPTCGAKYLN